MIVQEELFGPVVPCESHADVNEVMERANTKTALCTTVFGTGVAKATEVADQIESGTVWINSNPQPAPMAQFADVKKSGIATEFQDTGTCWP